MNKGKRQKLKGGDEFDAVGARKWHSWNKGILKKIKRKMNKRFRKAGKMSTIEHKDTKKYFHVSIEPNGTAENGDFNQEFCLRYYDNTYDLGCAYSLGTAEKLELEDIYKALKYFSAAIEKELYI